MSLAKKAIGGSIHKIREFELEKVNLAEEFDILQIVGEGWFGKILLVEHKATDTEMVLKALPKPYSALRDFYREFHYGLHLGAHRNIITTYDVAFETAGFYVFSQEYAPLGDLTSNVSETGIGELHAKRVARQLASALEHVHARDLVHRDVKLDNILVFKSDFSRIKLCDFGETRRVGSVVRRQNEWLPYAPPEVLQYNADDMYRAETIHDVWQFGIVIFVCLTGCLPWQKAAMDDPRYSRYISWIGSAISIRKIPKLFKLISSKAQRMFRKLLEPKPDRRPTTVYDVHKYLDDRWMAKGGGVEKHLGASAEDDGLCPSMYSYHSSPEEKNKLLFSLTQYGIETTVDRGDKKDRIRAWIENSIIDEEDEEEAGEAGDSDDERVHIMDNETGPVGERMDRGPVRTGTNRGQEEKKKRRQMREAAINKRNSAVYVPPVDPRIPLEQQRLTRSSINLSVVETEPDEQKYAPKDKYFEKFSSKALERKEREERKNKKDSSTHTSVSNDSNDRDSTDAANVVVNYHTSNETLPIKSPERTGDSVDDNPSAKMNGTYVDAVKNRNGSTDEKNRPNGISSTAKPKKAVATTQTSEVHVNEQPVKAPQVQLINSRDLRKDVRYQNPPPRPRYGYSTVGRMPQNSLGRTNKK